jgi:DNA-binding NarL/FixJ family response regulator
MLSEGKTNQQIADLRERSLGSTESMIARTLEALGIQNTKDVNGRVAAVRKYLNVVKPTD